MIQYRCIVSDAGFEDVVVPIRSFQLRYRQSPDQCYLNVVIPSILNYSAAIVARAGGTCKLEHIETTDEGDETVTELLDANIQDIRLDIGATSRSGSIMGTKQITFSDTSTIEVPEVQYKNTSEGVRRYRATPIPTLRPLHVADIAGDSISVEEIAWTVSANTRGTTQRMDIKELV